MTFNFFSISSRLYFEIHFKNYPDFIGPLIGHEWLNPVNVIRHSGVDSCVIGISACVSPARDTNLNAIDVDGTATVALFRIKTIHQHSVDNWIKFKKQTKNWIKLLLQSKCLFLGRQRTTKCWRGIRLGGLDIDDCKWNCSISSRWPSAKTRDQIRL